jgi:glucose/mannose-6-phosphate isomerase
MLDDLKQIHNRDAQDMLGVVEKQLHQLQHVFEMSGDEQTLATATIQNIVITGGEETILAAELCRSWPGSRLPLEISPLFELPPYVNGQTLFIAISYENNTEEIVAAITAAEQRQAIIAVITTEGELREFVATKNYPSIVLPGDVRPLQATLYVFKALVTLLARLNLLMGVNPEQLHHSLAETTGWLQQHIQSWLPVVATKDNYAKQLALECVGKSVVICAGPKLVPVAHKWKVNLNQYAHNIAWWSQFPDANAAGWKAQPVNKPYTVIDLHSNLEDTVVQQSFKEAERSLSGQRPSSEIVEAQGETILQQLLWTSLLGDFVSIYLALLNGVNPSITKE